jgi:hypothetical protein
MREQYEAWYRDVTSTRNFEMPRIYVGAPEENPVLLTRQDWRGPRAGWAADSLGHWDLEIRRAGNYQARLIFPALRSASDVNLSMGAASAAGRAPAGAAEITLRLRDIPSGPARLQATAGDSGVHYVDLMRL